MTRLFVSTIAIVMWCGTLAQSQVTFDKGYFITDTGERVECYIRNLDWANNPTGFDYSINETDGRLERSTGDTREFGIYDYSQYIRANVGLDRSSEATAQLNYDKTPKLSEEVVFLKILVTGRATLFEYADVNYLRFFYRVDSSKVRPLTYKVYRKDNGIAKNTAYRQELFNALPCNEFKTGDFLQLEYNGKALTKIFNTYNRCQGGESIDLYTARNASPVHLTLRPGAKISSLSLSNPAPGGLNVDFASKVGYRIGLMAELVLPFNRDKWALIVEPTFQSYKANDQSLSRELVVTYKSVEVPIGARHYLFVDDKSQVFVNAGVVFDFAFGSDITFQPNFSVFELKSNLNFAAGVGYLFDRRLSSEICYQTRRNVMREYAFYLSDYRSVALIFGYRLF